jgi:hypothetical protein
MISREVVFATSLVLVLRLAFFFSANLFVRRTLFSNLRKVVDDNGRGELSGFSASPQLGDDGESHLPLTRQDTLTPPSPASSSGGSRRRSFSPTSTPNRSRTTSSAIVVANHTLYLRAASIVFCFSCAESCVLLSLVLFGTVLGDK